MCLWAKNFISDSSSKEIIIYKNNHCYKLKIFTVNMKANNQTNNTIYKITTSFQCCNDFNYKKICPKETKNMFFWDQKFSSDSSSKQIIIYYNSFIEPKIMIVKYVGKQITHIIRKYLSRMIRIT